MITTRYESRIHVKNIGIFWKFKNVLKNANDKITFGEGYWSFNMISEKLAENNIQLERNRYDNTCKIRSSRQLNKNKGYRWILTAIEILSRFAFTIPVYKKDAKNMTKAVDLLLENFKRRFGKYPNVVQFDEGKEFYNVGVRNLLKSHNVDYFSTQSDKKAAIVERFNRALKTMMWKYFYSKGTYNWIDVLDKLTKNYNNTKHGSIHMKPKDVNKTNENMVWVTLYGSPLGKLPLPKFRIGDTVRVSKYKSIFGKGYEANFTEEIFKVNRVLRGDPTVYELEDHEGEPIIGKFYEEELSTVNKKTIRIE